MSTCVLWAEGTHRAADAEKPRATAEVRLWPTPAENISSKKTSPRTSAIGMRDRPLSTQCRRSKFRIAGSKAAVEQCKDKR